MTVNVKLFDSLAEVAADAGSALDRAHQPNLFHRIEWFKAIVEYCSAGRESLIARASDGTASAWMFLFRTGPRQAEAMTSWYSLNFDLVRDGRNAVLAESLAHSLRGLASLEIGPVADPEPLERAFRTAGWKVIRTVGTKNWRLSVPDNFEDYWASRPSRLRNTVKRKGKKAKLDIVIHRSFDKQAWDDYREIYASSWKPEEGSWDFLQDFAEREGEAGTLRLGIAYQSDRPLAAQCWHVENGTATIHKLAYREDAKAMSPGSILSAAMFRDIIERDRPEIIDYGTGDQPYKADWMDASRPLYELNMYYPRHPQAWLPLLKHWLSGLVHAPTSD